MGVFGVTVPLQSGQERGLEIAVEIPLSINLEGVLVRDARVRMHVPPCECSEARCIVSSLSSARTRTASSSPRPATVQPPCSADFQESVRHRVRTPNSGLKKTPAQDTTVIFKPGGCRGAQDSRFARCRVTVRLWVHFYSLPPYLNSSPGKSVHRCVTRCVWHGWRPSKYASWYAGSSTRACHPEGAPFPTRCCHCYVLTPTSRTTP